MKRYVDTNVDGDVVAVTARITVVYGYPILKIAKQVQARIKSEIERMTGLRVSAVNVDVQKIVKSESPVGDQSEEWEDEDEG